MLTQPITRRQLRHIAGVTLFAWAFALLSAVANACMIQPRAPGDVRLGLSHVGPVIGDAVAPALAARHAVPAHHHADEGHGGPVRDSAESACLKFCADDSSAVTKTKAAQADVAGSVFVAGALWPLAAPVASAAPWPAIERPASVGPALFIRLQRLTL